MFLLFVPMSRSPHTKAGRAAPTPTPGLPLRLRTGAGRAAPRPQRKQELGFGCSASCLSLVTPRWGWGRAPTSARARARRHPFPLSGPCCPCDCAGCRLSRCGHPFPSLLVKWVSRTVSASGQLSNTGAPGKQLFSLNVCLVRGALTLTWAQHSQFSSYQTFALEYRVLVLPPLITLVLLPIWLSSLCGLLWQKHG